MIDPEPLELPGSSPASWAFLPEDYNPIHVSPFFAQPVFGFEAYTADESMVLGMVVDRAAIPAQ